MCVGWCDVCWLVSCISLIACVGWLAVSPSLPKLIPIHTHQALRGIKANRGLVIKERFFIFSKSTVSIASYVVVPVLVWCVLVGVMCVGWCDVCWSVWCVLVGVMCVGWCDVCWLVWCVLVGVMCVGWCDVCWLVWCVLVGVMCVGWCDVCWLVWCVLIGVMCVGCGWHVCEDLKFNGYNVFTPIHTQITFYNTSHIQKLWVYDPIQIGYIPTATKQMARAQRSQQTNGIEVARQKHTLELYFSA